MESLKSRSEHGLHVEFVLGDDTFRVENGRLVPGPAWQPELSARVLEHLTRRLVRIVGEVVAQAEVGERAARKDTVRQVSTAARQGALAVQPAQESTDALEGKLLLRVSEVAPMISVSRSRCYELIASGEIPSVMVGRSRRVVASELRAWIEQKLRDGN